MRTSLSLSGQDPKLTPSRSLTPGLIFLSGFNSTCWGHSHPWLKPSAYIPVQAYICQADSIPDSEFYIL